MITNRTGKQSEKNGSKSHFSPYEFNKSAIYQTSRIRSLAANSQLNPNKTLSKIIKDNKKENDDYLDQHISPFSERGYSMHEVSMDQKKK